MFDPKTKQAYQKIKASPQLRERVLQKTPRKKGHLRYAAVGSLAAALALVFLTVGVLRPTPIGITVGELAVSEQATVLPQEFSAPRMVRADEQTTATVSFSKETTILSSDGLLTDADYTPVSLPYTVQASETILWHAQTPPQTFCMTVSSGRTTTQLFLTYEETQNYWTIYKK